MRLSTKLVLAATLPMLLLSGLVFWRIGTHIEDRFVEVASAQQFALAKQTASELDRMVEDHRRIIGNTGNEYEEALRLGRQPDVAGLKQNSLLKIHFPMGIFLTDSRGRVEMQSTENPLLATEASFHATIKAVLDTGVQQLSTPYLPQQHKLGDVPRLLFAYPIKDAQGRMLHVLAGMVSGLSTDFIGSILQIKIGYSGYAYLFTQSRMMIVHPQAERILQQDIAPGANAMIDRAIGGFEGADTTVNSRGVPMLVGMKRMDSTGWILGVSYPLAEVFAPIYAMRTYALTATLIAALLGIAITITLVRRSAKPLIDLTEHISHAANGTRTLTPVVLRGSGDTTANLARAYNQLIERIQGETQLQQMTRLELELEQDFLRSITDTLGEGLYVSDSAGRMTLVNPQACAMLGFNSQELLGNVAHAMFHHHYPDGKIYPRSECRLAMAASSGKPQFLEDFFWHKDGSLMRVSLNITPLSKAGLQLGSVTSFRDITEQERIRAALRESEERQSRIIELISDWVWEVDTRGAYTYASSRIVDLLGYSANEIIGKTPYDLMPAREAERVKPLFLKKMTARQSFAFIENAHLHKSGQEVVVESSGTPMFDNQGHFKGYRGIARNITQRKASEMALQEGEERFRSIAEVASDAIIVANSSGRIVYWNQAAVQTFGYPVQEALTMPLSQIVPTRFRQKHADGMARGSALHRAQSHNMRAEISALHQDGHEFPVELSVSSWNASDGVYASGIVRDITVRKRAELALIKARDEAAASVKVKSEFLANMSHEIRTPMNGIMGMTELVLDTPLTDKQRENLELVYSSAQSLLVIINDVLDLSKIEAGKLELESIPFNLDKNLSEILRTLLLRATQKGLALTLHMADDIPGQLCGDPVRLRQVLVNLINNAIKFTEAGEISITVLAERIARDDITLRFAVRDTGIGIARVKLWSIFEAFVQADSAINRQYGGTGLGLSISNTLVQKMQGRLWVESEEGRGSTFYFNATFARATVPQLLGDSGVSTPPDTQRGRSLRILLAEDNPINQKFAITLLAKAGHEVLLAHNGEEAVRLAETNEFDVILMDIQMPVMDGFTAARIIRTKKITAPMVALTAHALEGFREQCLDAGMNDYLSKPVRGAELLRLLQTLDVSQPVAVAAEQAKPLESDAILDLNTALLLTNGDLDLLGTLAGMVAQQMEDDLPQLIRFAAQNDGERLAQAAHRLKGSLATVGAQAASRACRALEMMCKENRSAEFERGVAALELALAQLRPQLEQLVGRSA